MSKRRRRGVGVPGNSVEEARVWGRFVHRRGINLLMLDRLMVDGRDKENVMKEIRVYKRGEKGDEFMAVVKGVEAGRQVVGFHTATTPAEALAMAIEKYNNASLPMREDTPYNPQA